MAKIAKTGDRKKVMDTNKSTDCPKCSKPTRIVKRVKDRERGVPGGVYISCSACDFFEKLWHVVASLGDAHGATVAVGLSSLAAVLALRRFVPAMPWR